MSRNIPYIPTAYPWDQSYSPGSPQNVSNGPPHHAAHTSSELLSVPIVPLGNCKPHVNLENMSSRLPELYGQLAQNTKALSCLTQVVNLLKQGFWPENHHLNGLVAQYSNGFRCVVPNCEKHMNGFDREDRAREHFVIAHLGGAYQCPLWLVPSDFINDNELTQTCFVARQHVHGSMTWIFITRIFTPESLLLEFPVRSGEHR
jgi:hypothetical protein